MLQNIYSQAQKEINTDKFLSLPLEKRKKILEELYQTIILGLKKIIITNVKLSDKKELEKLIRDSSEEKLVIFGNKYIDGFTSKVNFMLNQVVQAFTYDITR